MDKTLKQKWIDALRSGKYQQGTGALRDTADAYCCLGVLCDVSGLGMWESHAGELYTYMVPREGENPSWSTRGPQPYVREQVGLSIEHMLGLIDLNDNEKNHFPRLQTL